MDHQKAKWRRRLRRRRHIRKRIAGTAQRPRLSVYRSLTNIYCQLIDDHEGKTLLAVSTRSPEIREATSYGGNAGAARAVGKTLAEKALGKGIQQAVFDRGGCKFHGRMAALADSARKAGFKV
jgi:large subunit ribosomal protein L18